MAKTYHDTSGHAASATPTAPAANKATLAIVGKDSRNQRCLTCPKMKCFRGCSGNDSLCVQTGIVSVERIEDTRSMHLQGHREGRPQNAQGVCNSGSESSSPPCSSPCKLWRVCAEQVTIPVQVSEGLPGSLDSGVKAIPLDVGTSRAARFG